MDKYNPDYIDDEEKDLIESLNDMDIKKIDKLKKEDQQRFQKAANAFVRQEAKMNIRIDPVELQKIKEFAANEGLKYQTFIKSIIHKYVTGQLVEKEKAAG